MARIIFICSIVIAVFLPACQESAPAETVQVDTTDIEQEPELLYGIQSEDFRVIKGVIRPNEFLSDILLKHGVDYSRIHELAIQSKEVYDVRKLGRGKEYTIFCTKDSNEIAQCFVYQANEIDYIVYDFSSDSIQIRPGKKPVEIKDQFARGEIEYSLYQSMQDNEQDVALAFEMAEIYAWTIDFYRLQPGDAYKIYYKERYVEDQAIGIERVEAVEFIHEGYVFKAYYFEQDSLGDYFNEDAESLRKAFLKSPLKFSRLTSGFTRRRFHPVQKRWKAHLGTDYAAPTGTPIRATGDGKIIEARYKKYNGNYVKIRHNGTYNTQYLHMQKIAKGMKPGKFVQQGEIIGYVGSTGLATGPHVCYRFWKNGQQVNHLKEDFPPSTPVEEKNIPAFKIRMKELNERLSSDS